MPLLPHSNANDLKIDTVWVKVTGSISSTEYPWGRCSIVPRSVYSELESSGAIVYNRSRVRDTRDLSSALSHLPSGHAQKSFVREHQNPLDVGKLQASRKMHQHKYAVNSGVEAIVCPETTMELFEDGLFRANHLNSPDDTTHDPNIGCLVDSMSDESMDETELADELFGSNTNFHPDIGRYSALYAGHVATGDFRENGSSGGVATWLLVKLLESDLIDGVIHLRESSEGDSVLFRYAISTTVEEIKRGAKSRYYPGEMSDTLKQAIQDGSRYAITGIPSFITEVRLLAKVMPEIAESIKFYVGLICGHQKSAKYAEALAWQYGISPGNLHSIDFRKKNPGGRASQYLLEMTGKTKDGVQTITKPASEPFVGHWGHGFFKPVFSDFTDDALNETADVALGDAWLPEYDIDGNGNNIVIVRNRSLLKLFEEGIRLGDLRLDVIDEDTVIQSQRGLIHHTREEIGYRLHKADSNGEWRPQKRIPASDDLPFLRRRVQDIRQAIAETSHSAYQKAVAADDWTLFENEMRPLVQQYRFWYFCIRVTTLTPRKVFGKFRSIYDHRLRDKFIRAR